MSILLKNIFVQSKFLTIWRNFFFIFLSLIWIVHFIQLQVREFGEIQRQGRALPEIIRSTNGRILCCYDKWNYKYIQQPSSSCLPSCLVIIMYLQFHFKCSIQGLTFGLLLFTSWHSVWKCPASHIGSAMVSHL